MIFDGVLRNDSVTGTPLHTPRPMVINGVTLLVTGANVSLRGLVLRRSPLGQPGLRIEGADCAVGSQESAAGAVMISDPGNDAVRAKAY